MAVEGLADFFLWPMARLGALPETSGMTAVLAVEAEDRSIVATALSELICDVFVSLVAPFGSTWAGERRRTSSR